MGWAGRTGGGETKSSRSGLDWGLSKAKPKPRRVNEIQGAGWDEMEWTRSRKLKVKPQKDENTPFSLALPLSCTTFSQYCIVQYCTISRLFPPLEPITKARPVLGVVGVESAYVRSTLRDMYVCIVILVC